MNRASTSLRVAVVGADDVVSRLRAHATDTPLTIAETTEVPAAGEADCLVVDEAAVPDRWRSMVRRVPDPVPTVVLLANGSVVGAMEVGADEFLPRSVCATDPTALLDRLEARYATEPPDPSERPAVDHADRFRLVAESVNEIIYIANEDFTAVHYANAAYEEIWGRPVDELYDDATAFVDGIDPRDREAFLADFEAMQADIQRGEPADVYEFEFRVRRPDGEVRWVLATGYPVSRDRGPDRYVGIAEDVTDRRELERTYRELFEGVSDGLVVHEPESGDIVDVNERYCELTGYDREALVDANVRLIVPEDSAYTHQTALSRIEDARSEGPQLFEFEGKRKDGERFDAEVHLSTIEVDGRERVLASVRDVTARKHRERAIQTLQAATERMQQTDSAAAVADIAVETAAGALELPMTACWFHDDASDALEPVSATDAVHDRELLSALSSDRFEYGVFESGSVETYVPNRVNPDNPLETAILLPLGDHGLLAAGRPDQTDYDEVTLDIARTLAEYTANSLDRIERERRLRESQNRLEAVVDRIDEAIFLAPVAELDKGQPAPDYVSSGYETIWGQPLDGLHESYDEGFFGTLHEADYDQYRALIDRIVEETITGTPEERYATEYRIERPDGEVRWVHSDFYPTAWRDDDPRVVIVSRDVTDRVRRQRKIESFHDATAKLTTADTPEEACDLAVTAAADVFDMPTVAVYRYDDETGTLDPTTAGPGVSLDGLQPLSSSDGSAWNAFVDTTMRRVEPAESPRRADDSPQETLVLPLGDNGLLAVWPTGDEVDTDGASIIAATLEAALNRLRGERRLETQREELRRQTERADRLESITELTRRVDAALTTESSRAGLYDSVCAQLCEVDPFQAAWIAGAAVGSDRLTRRSVAGIDADLVDRLLGADGDAEQHPLSEVWQTGEPLVYDDLVGGPRGDGWRQSLLKAGISSLCAVPVTHSGITYGLLTVLADEPGAFGGEAIDVLSQLGTSIGYAVTAIERQRALESDDTVELEFQGAGADLPFATLARETDSVVAHERTIRRQDGSVSVYYSISEDPPADVDERAAALLPGTVEVVTRQGGDVVLERRGSTWFGSAISESGGVLRRGRATGDRVELVVELPTETDTRAVVERVESAYPDLDLTAQRQHSEMPTTPGEVTETLERRLSDRQFEAIETAHAMGYFEWPRANDGEAVADTLDITQPTVNKHIRLGERKVFDELFGSDVRTSTE
jgi:PAS domain S-box-containing protein